MCYFYYEGVQKSLFAQPERSQGKQPSRTEARPTQMRLIRRFKHLVFPYYRRSYQIARYRRLGYTAQEALAKVKVIEA